MGSGMTAGHGRRGRWLPVALACAMALVPAFRRGVGFVGVGRSAARSPSPRPASPLAVSAGAHEAEQESELISIARKFVVEGNGFYSAADPDVFASDFVFRGPLIGPLNKEDYLSTVGVFKPWKAIPDISANAWGFSIDPEDAQRVWFLVRNTGTFTGEPGIGLPYGLHIPPNGAKIEGLTETFSLTFNEQKKVKCLTIGYVADRFQGNVKGQAALVGILGAIGFPYPAPGPLLDMVLWFGSADSGLAGAAKTWSKSEDVPAWWPHSEKGPEGYA